MRLTLLSSFVLFTSVINASPMKREAETSPVPITSLEARQNAGDSTCSSSGSVPLFRAFSPSTGDHFYTTNSAELQNAVSNLGYQSEGVAANIFTSQVLGTVPLFRLFNPSVTDHFYTINAAERANAIANVGYSDEGIAGFVLQCQFPGSIPLFRLLNSQVFDHFYTTNAAERDNAERGGYTSEGTTAFVWPA